MRTTAEELIEKYEDALSTVPETNRTNEEWTEYNLWSEFLEDLRSL